MPTALVLKICVPIREGISLVKVQSCRLPTASDCSPGTVAMMTFIGTEALVSYASETDSCDRAQLTEKQQQLTDQLVIQYGNGVFEDLTPATVT